MSNLQLVSHIPWREVREIIAGYERQLAELKLRNEQLKNKNDKLRRKSRGKDKE
jgi:cell division protein FtsB